MQVSKVLSSYKGMDYLLAYVSMVYQWMKTFFSDFSDGIKSQIVRVFVTVSTNFLS